MPKRQAKQERKKNQQKSVNPVHHRCNFLFQAADLLSSASSSTASNLAAKFGKLAKECQKKGLIKLHPYSKRIICKKCHRPLFRFFGSNEKKSAKIRYRPRRSPHLVVTCLNCGCLKRFLISNRDYELWIEKEEEAQMK